MTFPYQQGRYTVGLAATAGDVVECQILRHLCFRGRIGRDRDRFDAGAHHLMISNESGLLLATCRFRLFPHGRAIGESYGAQFYDLSTLADTDAPMLEVGRFCCESPEPDPDLVRIAWAALGRIVDDTGAQLLFGCSSFAGTDPAPYGRALTQLAARSLGPVGRRPRPKAPEIVRFADVRPDGAAPLPGLLRSYLAMGGWVSDHAVIDRRMNTLHVFTCLDVAAIPAARASRLRALALDRAVA